MLHTYIYTCHDQECVLLWAIQTKMMYWILLLAHIIGHQGIVTAHESAGNGLGHHGECGSGKVSKCMSYTQEKSNLLGSLQG